MCSGRGIDKLSRDPHFAPSLADAAFQDVPHPQLSPDLLHVHRPTPVRKTGVSGDDEQSRKPRQCRDDLLGYAIRKITLITVGTKVIEWQDSNGWLVG